MFVSSYNFRKSNEQIHRKVLKSWFWVPKCPIYPILNITRFFLNEKVFSLFSVYSTLASCKKSEKINSPILIKRLTERRTDALSWNRVTLQQSREYNKMKVYNACDSTSLRTKLEKITKSYKIKSQEDENCFETASGITSLYYDTKLQALWTYFYIFIIRPLTLDAKYWRVDKELTCF